MDVFTGKRPVMRCMNCRRHRPTKAWQVLKFPCAYRGDPVDELELDELKFLCALDEELDELIYIYIYSLHFSAFVPHGSFKVDSGEAASKEVI